MLIQLIYKFHFKQRRRIGFSGTELFFSPHGVYRAYACLCQTLCNLFVMEARAFFFPFVDDAVFVSI